MEETWQAVFRNLYTGFLLRDFAGKIVPGVYLLFSITSMFRAPVSLVKEIRKEVPVFAVILMAGLAWTTTLGTQSLAEALGIWKYFPAGSASAQPKSSPHIGFWVNLFQGDDETNFEANTAKVDLFQIGATEDEKQQYERFVVVKEACGNLFIAGLLSLPAWLVVIFSERNSDGATVRNEGNPRRPRSHLMVRIKTLSRGGIGFVYFAVIMIGLHRMNLQHVGRQMRFTEIVIENRRNQPQTPAAVVPKPESPKHP
jgi:Trk-type K+ transport system membrane component